MKGTWRHQRTDVHYAAPIATGLLQGHYSVAPDALVGDDDPLIAPRRDRCCHYAHRAYGPAGAAEYHVVSYSEGAIDDELEPAGGVS